MGWLEDGSHGGQGRQSWTAAAVTRNQPGNEVGLFYGASESTWSKMPAYVNEVTETTDKTIKCINDNCPTANSTVQTNPLLLALNAQSSRIANGNARRLTREQVNCGQTYQQTDMKLELRQLHTVMNSRHIHLDSGYIPFQIFWAKM